MDIKFLGTGSAFTLENYQSNAVIKHNGKNLLIDCGTDIRFSLREANIDVNDVDAIYVSHAHADHIGGLEFVAFATYFNPNAKKPTLFIHESWSDELWTESLKGGLQGIEGKKMKLDDFFEVVRLEDNEEWAWQGIKFNCVETLHIFAQYSKIDSFGLMFNQPDGSRIYFTTDCQFAPETSQKAFYSEANHIFHDCETSPFRSGVHAHYEDLKTLSTEIKAKMWLYHYQDNVSINFDDWNKKAINDGFAGFIRKGAIFNEQYGMQNN